jgi:hypothetical protein
LQLLFLHSALSHFSVVSSVGYVARFSLLCVRLPRSPSFLFWCGFDISHLSVSLLSPLPTLLSSSRSTLFFGCCGGSLCFTPLLRSPTTLFLLWLHELCILFGFLLPALQHLSFLWPIDSWGRRSLTLFTPLLISPVDLPTSSPRSMLLLFQSGNFVGVVVGMKYWEHVSQSPSRITSGVLRFWEIYGGFGAKEKTYNVHHPPPMFSLSVPLPTLISQLQSHIIDFL